MIHRVRDSGDSLRPPSAHQSPRPPSSAFEPIDPSPITSDKTDIEDSAEEAEPEPQSASEDVQSPASKQSDKPVGIESRLRSYGDEVLGLIGGCVIQMIDTSVATRPRSSSSETPQSVIHAPEGFRELVSGRKGD